MRTCVVPAALMRSSSAAILVTLGTPSSARRPRSLEMRPESVSSAEWGTHGPP
ncbi:hypothetical protein [Nonomuraea rubra]|uniref:hypothetical protein n=1 Tax=Nonomuraea rubra TaxID=46180 RepID=UPI0031E9D6BF